MRRALPLWTAGLLTALAVAARLADGTAWPVPFHPTVQHESALAARAIWLAADPAQRSGERAAWYEAVGFGHVVSPPVLPALAAGCYLVAGEEVPWVSKLLAAGFWAAAGWFVLLAVRRQTGSGWAGVAGLAWLLAAPFGLFVSRSFQAEPVLACGLAAAVWRLSRPGREPGWRDGLVCGLCALAKPGMLFAPLLAGFAAGGAWRRPAQLAAFAALTAGPSLLYVRLVLPHRGGELMPELLAEPWFYDRLGRLVERAVGGPALTAGLVGAALACRAGNRLLAGLIVGTAGTVAVFTYHAATHDYYHTPLLVLAAVGLGWCGHALLARGRYGAVALVLLTAACAEPWRLPRLLRPAAGDSSREAADVVRAVVPSGEGVVAVGSDYGLSLEFRTCRPTAFWPRRADVPAMTRAGVLPPDFAADRHLAAAGWRFVVVTDATEFAAQPELAAALARRGRLIATGPGVRVYELSAP